MYYPQYPYPYHRGSYGFYGPAYGRGLAYARGCCKPLVKRVVCVDPCSDPVILTIDGLFSELAQKNCFKLIICANTLQMASVHPVVLTDGCAVLPLIEGCSNDVVRYDQLVALVNGNQYGCGKDVVLDCYYGNDGAPKNELHISCNTMLPRSTNIPMPPPIA